MTVLLHAALFLELIGGAAIFAAARGSGRKAGNFAIDPLGLKKVLIVLHRKTLYDHRVVGFDVRAVHVHSKHLYSAVTAAALSV
jgi:hypothetical protein